MRPTYYQIELTGRMLTALLVALALLLVLAFAFGYGAAWSVLSARQPAEPGGITALPGAAVPDRTPTPTPTAREVAEVPVRPPATLAVSHATPVPTPTERPLPTPRPVPPTPRPQPTSPGLSAGGAYWVQVLAVEDRRAIDTARDQLVENGFPRDHHRVEQTKVAGGSLLYKLRVGPFIDAESATRVKVRMRSSGFPDAWVVPP
jgi:cell division protein FtsN